MLLIGGQMHPPDFISPNLQWAAALCLKFPQVSEACSSSPSQTDMHVNFNVWQPVLIDVQMWIVDQCGGDIGAQEWERCPAMAIGMGLMHFSHCVNKTDIFLRSVLGWIKLDLQCPRSWLEFSLCRVICSDQSISFEAREFSPSWSANIAKMRHSNWFGPVVYLSTKVYKLGGGKAFTYPFFHYSGVVRVQGMLCLVNWRVYRIIE